MFFFSTRADLTFLKKVRSECDHANVVNIDTMIATIVDSRLATLNELKTIYTIEDAFNLWEIIMVSRYNEYLANKAAIKKASI